MYVSYEEISKQRYVFIRALEILKSESVQPMTMTSSTSQFPKSRVTKTNVNWQSPIYPF